MISLAQDNEYLIFLISFCKLLDMLPAFTCAGAIGSLWIICVGVHILRLGWFETLSEKPAPSIFIGNFLLSKELRTLSVSTFRKII